MPRAYELLFRHATYYLEVLQKASELYVEGDSALRRGLELFDLEYSNIESGQVWAETHAKEDNRAAILCKDYPNAAIDLLDLRFHPHDSIRWIKAGLRAARQLQDRDAEAKHLDNLGRAYSHLGELDRAITFSMQALEIFREIGDLQGERIALTNLGQMHHLMGKVNDAIEFSIQALIIAQETGDKRGEGDGLINLGRAYHLAGEFRRAIKLYEKSFDITRAVRNSRSENIVLNHLGLAYRAIGDTNHAIELYEQALVIARELRDHRGESIALSNLGQAYYILGDSDRARELYEQALSIARTIDDRMIEIELLKSLGDICIDSDDIDRAVRFHAQRFNIGRELNSRQHFSVEEELDNSLARDTMINNEKPSNVNSSIASQTLTWIHLSDLHFRESQTTDENIVLEPLLEDISERSLKDDMHPDFIAITGDLAFSGKPSEYALAHIFLDKLLGVTRLSPKQLFIVPGNHDVDRGRIPLSVKSLSKSLADREITNTVLDSPEERRLFLSRFAGYAEFFNGYFSDHLTFDNDNYFFVHVLDVKGKRIAILGLNSAWISESDEDEMHKVIIGERQVRLALKHAEKAGAELKIALLHHPAEWVRGFDRSDSMELIRVKCDLVLHGHLHEAATTFWGNPDSNAILIAGGACYDTRRYPNSYNIVKIDFGTKRGAIHFRRYSDAPPGFWAKDTLLYRNVPDGVYEFTII